MCDGDNEFLFFTELIMVLVKVFLGLKEKNQIGFNRGLLIGLNENALQGCIAYPRLSQRQSQV